ncbi:MAG: hypothetical protein JNL32_15305, partial [Candidatus Kapabacteria bacterium]|nr:hypothetical protein [Candidatus Kapabacteria bacterium]
MSNRHYTVVFRACDIVNAVNNNPRPFNLDKRTLIKLCFNSLAESLESVDHTIRIVGDKLSDEMMDFFASYSSRHSIKLTNGSYGNDESIRHSFKAGLEAGDDAWVYFCEDDYLHVPHCMSMIDDFLEHKDDVFSYRPRIYNPHSWRDLRTADIVIHPPDYPDRYAVKYRKPSYIFQSSLCHWRQVQSTTFTFMLNTSFLKKRYSTFVNSAHRANDHYLSRKLYTTFIPV